MGDEDEDITCAICYETFNNENGVLKAPMPCCEVNQASTIFCIRCIEIICERSSGEDNIGKCPRCSQYIEVRDGVVVKSTAPLIVCSICRQRRLHCVGRDREHTICVSCHFGIQNRLRYECDRCHRIQMIPHPMYRYQEHPTSFGNTTWACHVGCGDYTRWRIIPLDVRRVPVDDAPDSWGLQEHEFETIRGIRRAELQRREGDAHGNDGEGQEGAVSSLRSRLYHAILGFFSTGRQ